MAKMQYTIEANGTVKSELSTADQRKVYADTLFFQALSERAVQLFMPTDEKSIYYNIHKLFYAPEGLRKILANLLVKKTYSIKSTQTFRNRTGINEVLINISGLDSPDFNVMLALNPRNDAYDILKSTRETAIAQLQGAFVRDILIPGYEYVFKANAIPNKK